MLTQLFHYSVSSLSLLRPDIGVVMECGWPPFDLCSKMTETLVCLIEMRTIEALSLVLKQFLSDILGSYMRFVAAQV